MKICGARWHLFSYELLGYSTFRLLGHHVALLSTEHNCWEEMKWGGGTSIWMHLAIDSVPVLHMFSLKLREVAMFYQMW